LSGEKGQCFFQFLNRAAVRLIESKEVGAPKDDGYITTDDGLD